MQTGCKRTANNGVAPLAPGDPAEGPNVDLRGLSDPSRQRVDERRADTEEHRKPWTRKPSGQR
jgi:hypothetical protein